jgi:hypothetical protein
MHFVMAAIVVIVALWYTWGAILLSLIAITKYVMQHKVKATTMLVAVMVFCFGPTALIIQSIMTVALFGYTAYWLVNNFNNPKGA